MVTVEKLRPDIPPEVDELPGGAFAGLAEYIDLMKACWAQDAAERPDFETIIGRLRRLLAVESLSGRGGSGAQRTDQLYGFTSTVLACVRDSMTSPTSTACTR